MFLLPGLWAFVAPESFFESAATFAPYNEHFIRDIGAFQLVVGSLVVTVLAAGMLLRTDETHPPVPPPSPGVGVGRPRVCGERTRGKHERA